MNREDVMREDGSKKESKTNETECVIRKRG